MSSLCDLCYKPGWCCSGFSLSREGEEWTFWASRSLESIHEELEKEGFPFKILEERWRVNDPESGSDYVTYTFTCPKLGDDGRCTIYEDRPATCRNFEPAGNVLCVHFQGAESGADET